MNTRIARLERVAEAAGVALRKPTKNSREFDLGGNRTARFYTEGRSTMRIIIKLSGVEEASVTARDDKVSELIIKAAQVTA